MPHRNRWKKFDIYLIPLLFIASLATYFLFRDRLTKREFELPVNIPPPPLSIVADQQKTILHGPAEITLETGAEMSVTWSGTSSDSQLQLTHGRMWVSVRPLARGQVYLIKTVNTTVGVRGTRFIVETFGGGALTYVQVIEGIVFVEGITGDAVELQTGEAIRVQGMSPPEEAAPTYDETGFPVEEGQGATLAPRASETGAPLSGQGTWKGSYGFSGPVSMVIDLARGKFRGDFEGAAVRGNQAMKMQGSFEGNYSGDRNSGALEGMTAFTINGKSNQGTVRGTFDGATVTGAIEGAGEITVTF